MSNELNDFFNEGETLEGNSNNDATLDDFFNDSDNGSNDTVGDLFSESNIGSNATIDDFFKGEDNLDNELFGDSNTENTDNVEDVFNESNTETNDTIDDFFKEDTNLDNELFGDSNTNITDNVEDVFNESNNTNEWGTEDSDNSWLEDGMETNSKEEPLSNEPNEDGSVNWMTEPQNPNTSSWSSDFDNSKSEWESDFEDNNKSSSDWVSDFDNSNSNRGWESNTSNSSGWEDDFDTSTDGWSDDFDTDFNNTTNDTNNTNETLKVLEQIKHKFNFNYKQVSLIIACGCILIALLFLGVSKIHISSNRSVNQQNLTKETNQVQQNSSGSQELRYIPPTTKISYSEEVVTSSGKIKMKQKYLLGTQLVYDLVVEMKAGVENVNLHYYCTKDTFDTVYEGTTVTINYQVVDNNYYSIKNIIAN